jgi:hypothetical protein
LGAIYACLGQTWPKNNSNTQGTWDKGWLHLPMQERWPFYPGPNVCPKHVSSNIPLTKKLVQHRPTWGDKQAQIVINNVVQWLANNVTFCWAYGLCSSTLLKTAV